VRKKYDPDMAMVWMQAPIFLQNKCSILPVMRDHGAKMIAGVGPHGGLNRDEAYRHRRVAFCFRQ
jgi:hypothetical protein